MAGIFINQLDKYDDFNFDAILGKKGVILGHPCIKQKTKKPQIDEQNTCLPSAYLFYFSRTSNFNDCGQKRRFWRRLALNPSLNFTT